MRFGRPLKGLVINDRTKLDHSERANSASNLSAKLLVGQPMLGRHIEEIDHFVAPGNIHA